MVFEFIGYGLDFALGPLLNLPPLLGVAIVSVLVSVIITAVYKLVTNQSLMKDLKNEIKELQKTMKELRDRPEEAMKVQKKAMETNMKYMTHSFKPTLITFIPIILIFGWMNGHFAYEPISPGEEFQVDAIFGKTGKGDVEISVPKEMEIDGNVVKTIEDNKVSWLLKGEQEGKYFLEFKYKGEVHEKDVLITNGKSYADKSLSVKGSDLKSISIDYDKNIVLNLFGWKLGWLGVYIIFSLVSTIALRKFLKVY
tara:strand:+ start:641 stop:1402 length:762 start_codon:yes stop_codon:yes gene_type:complete